MKNSAMNNSFMRQRADTTIDTSNFTPDDWVKYITPLVNRALADAKGGINPDMTKEEIQKKLLDYICDGIAAGTAKSE
ncbi:hypothetical protein [Clostridium saccharoperbutylacetonicum]|uniref:hypothetical protein n=1 Tax=Clostridium saccharoperbutylacetonicum TaxID=36745 RepID=UPI0039E848CC